MRSRGEAGCEVRSYAHGRKSIFADTLFHTSLKILMSASVIGETYI